jgi:ACS family hexuronate transporter-like MFS transporter
MKSVSTSEPVVRERGVRFQVGLVVLLFGIALINYFDRQSLSVVIPHFQSEMRLSDAGYSHIVTAFLFASALGYASTGFIAGRLGTRLSIALFVGWWSIAEALTAFASSAWMLGATRFMLGLGEPGLWVGAPQAVGEFIEREKRTAAIGFYTLGATAGAVVALPVIVAVTTHLPWRSIFLLDGGCGLLWLPLWFWWLGDRGAKPPKLAFADRQHAAGSAVLLRQILGMRRMWQLFAARALTDPVWYFYLFWFPKYLADSQHFTLHHIARTAWCVYLSASGGAILGGLTAGLYIRRGHTPAVVNRAMMACAAMLVPLSPLTTLHRGTVLPIAVGVVVVFAHMCWLVNLTALLVELFPASQVATAAGLIAAGSALGGMVFSEIIGYVVTHSGYSPLFWIMACLHPLALAAMWTAATNSQPRAAA